MRIPMKILRLFGIFIFAFSLVFLFIAYSVRANEAGAPTAQGTPESPGAPRRAIPENRTQSLPAGVTAINPATAQELALAMGVPSADLVSADLMGSDAAGVGVSDAPLGSWFPTQGGTFAILSTGKAADAPLPNNEGNLSTQLGGLDNSEGNDLVRLHMQLKVPAEANCAAFDFAYYSEEFPEWVGSIYNDTFTAQLDDSTLIIEGNKVTAPKNFAFDSEGNIISVNTVFGVNAPTGTTYDGVTPLLRAQTAVTPTATVDLYLSIQDLGDSIYDSAVFLDKFFWSQDPNCESGASVDTDGDGLLDNWETNGITVTVGGTPEFVDLPAMGADPQHKDVFIEIDWLGPETAGGHTHAPKADAIQKIVDSFNDAPVTNPDGTSGIHLHVDYGPSSPLAWGSAATWGSLSDGEELTHQAFISTCTGTSFNWDGFDTIKQDHLTPGRAAIFHYNVWGHSMCSTAAGTSGISRNGGGATFGSGASDFIVSLGAWTSGTGTVNEQAGTLMHELGHNLGLRHGGPDHTQWKPNYLSVMGYSFQTRGLIINNTEGHFDYSRFDLSDLNESNLNETLGVNLPGTLTTTYGTRYFCALNDMRTDLDATAVDWNCDGDEADTSVSRNINQGMSWNNNATLDTLTSQEDWSNLVYTGGAISQPGADVSLPENTEIIDITEEQDADIPDLLSFIYLPITVRE